MKRILHYVGQMDVGGIESLIMSIYRNIDRKKIQFDFAVHTTRKCFYDDEIEELGGRFFRFPMFRDSITDYRKAWENFWYEYHDEFDVFHFHTPTFGNVIAMQKAKKYGVPIIIAHCHNIYSNKGKMQKIHDLIHRYHGDHIKNYANVFCACSPEAAQWGFGDQYSDGLLDVHILKNGIDLNKFTYNSVIRNNIRDQLCIADRFVIGHVGRLCAQKNQKFLIDIFYEVKKQKSNSVLLLIGTGPDEQALKDKARELGIENDVMFLGARSDVADLMMAMDYFVFPSIHEGLGIVLIEAQAIGLQIIASKDCVPNEAKATDLVTFIPLEMGPKQWAKTIVEGDNNVVSFINTHNEIRRHGYDIKDTVARYTELIENYEMR